MFLIGDSVTGQFDDITDDLAFLDAVLGYSNTNAHFTLVGSGNNYADIACTPNTFHVGVYLEEIAGSASGDLADLLAALDQGAAAANLAVPGVNTNSLRSVLGSTTRRPSTSAPAECSICGSD